MNEGQSGRWWGQRGDRQIIHGLVGLGKGPMGCGSQEGYPRFDWPHHSCEATGVPIVLPARARGHNRYSRPFHGCVALQSQVKWCRLSMTLEIKNMNERADLCALVAIHPSQNQQAGGCGPGHSWMRMLSPGLNETQQRGRIGTVASFPFLAGDHPRYPDEVP